MSETFDDIVAGMLDDTPDLLTDPDMQVAIDRVREINLILRSRDCTPDEINAYLAEANALWKEWASETVTASGTIHFALESDTPRTANLRSTPVYSDSFAVLMPPLAGLESPEIVHDIKVHPLDILPEDDPALEGLRSLDPEDMPCINAIAKLDVSIMPLDLTSERALQYLELFYPNLIAEIDRRIMNSHNAAEGLLALRCLKLNEFADLDSDMTKAAITVYIESSIVLDEDMPYEITLGSGTIYSAATQEFEDSPVTVNGERFYATVRRGTHLTLQQSGEGDDPSYMLAIDLAVLTADHREQERPFCVPIDAIDGMQSLRQMLFGR